ncbi:Armadillo-type fold [Sesbania bispinosa]|nr:Armadillo-type fold [Sesbania bispinosa]
MDHHRTVRRKKSNENVPNYKRSSSQLHQDHSPEILLHLSLLDNAFITSDSHDNSNSDDNSARRALQLISLLAKSGLLAVKPEYQQLIVDAGALPYLVDLLRRHRAGGISPELTGMLKKVADAITNLAHENTSVKTLVRMEGGIPPLVELLEFNDIKIVGCNALPTLVLMLRSGDPTIHYEAVGVIGNLVHSSPNIKKDVIEAGVYNQSLAY